MIKPKLLIFDINETLLDMEPLKKSINEALKEERAFDIWFPTLLQYSLVETLTKNYKDFSEIAGATLKMTAQKLDIDLTEVQIKSILSPITKLSAYPEVSNALKVLKQNGFKLVALSNGKPQVVIDQLKYARIHHFFDKVLSIEEVKNYKPHASTYHCAYSLMNVLPEDTMLIAAHGWDIAGAKRAGIQAAFISRPGKSLYPLAIEPEIIGSNLKEITESLLSF
ncbi:haloacid dehalogenase type II [Gillisia hiemivivida]|uniref:Haloacid dehalogenase type II n=1 Tax=Gillisia hiemivivida TaxID=291190 RepID=A0A5C6ZZ22_9FLAO|nr:haloacid dehalogenase type II [Gillisia hiemivivida]TXD95694.1 haloacid dehalogenase type II [Gillisia hiemivivida]